MRIFTQLLDVYDSGIVFDICDNCMWLHVRVLSVFVNLFQNGTNTVTV